MRLLFSTIFFITIPFLSWSQISDIETKGIIYADSPDRVPNQYIVIYKKQEYSDLLKQSNNTVASALDITQSLALQSNSQVIHVYDKVLFGSALFNTSQASIESLLSNINVKYIYADIRGHATTGQRFPPSNLDRIDQSSLPLDQFYNYTSTGDGVNVYVVDSGVLASHPDFLGRVVNTVDFTSDQGTSLENIDALGHGTGVAGVIGGSLYGVAKNVTIESLKVIRQDGSPNGHVSTSDLNAALNYIANNYNPNQPNVVNLSLAFSYTPYSLHTAIENLIDRNIIVVSGSGNGGKNSCDFPSKMTNVISVGAMNSLDDKRWIESNYSTCVDVYSPGYSVESSAAQGGSLYYRGTSFASPHVAGAVALYLENNPGTNAVSMRAILRSTASRGKIKHPNSSDFIPSNENYLLNVTNLMPNNNNMTPDIYEQDDNNFSNNNVIGINNTPQEHNFEDDTIDWVSLTSDTLGRELNSPDGQCNNLVCGLEFSNVSQELLSLNDFLCFQYSSIDPFTGTIQSDMRLCGINDGFFPRSSLVVPQSNFGPFPTSCDSDYQLAWNNVKISLLHGPPNSNKSYDVKFRCDYDPTPNVTPDIYEDDDSVPSAFGGNIIGINNDFQQHNFADDSIDWMKIQGTVNAVPLSEALGVGNGPCENLACGVQLTNVSNYNLCIQFSKFELFTGNTIYSENLCNLSDGYYTLSDMINYNPDPVGPIFSHCDSHYGINWKNIQVTDADNSPNVSKTYDIKFTCSHD